MKRTERRRAKGKRKENKDKNEDNGESRKDKTAGKSRAGRLVCAFFNNSHVAKWPIILKW